MFVTSPLMRSELLEDTTAWIVTSPMALTQERVAKPVSYQIGNMATDLQTSKRVHTLDLE